MVFKMIPDTIAEEVSKLFNKKSKEMKKELNSRQFSPNQQLDLSNVKLQWQYYSSYCAKFQINVSIVTNCLYYKEFPTVLNIEIKNNSQMALSKYQIIIYCVKERSDLTCKAGLNEQVISSNQTQKILCFVNKITGRTRDFYLIHFKIACYDRVQKKIEDLNIEKTIEIKIDKVEACIEELDQMFKFRSKFSLSRMEEALMKNKFDLLNTCRELLK